MVEWTITDVEVLEVVEDGVDGFKFGQVESEEAQALKTQILTSFSERDVIDKINAIS